ncbi:MAG: rhodanese-like domain-containing protein [Devosia sp.]
MRYFMSIIPPADLKQEDVPQGLMDAMGPWMEKSIASGALVSTGGLKEASAGRRLKGHSGAVRSTDGPFSEAKEVVGGYAVFEAPDLDAATKLAAEFLQFHIDNGLTDVTLEIRQTPGHTPESISIVVWERAEDSEPWGVLTGDTLFIGDVGRPDLLTSIGWTAQDLGRRLYRSVHDQLLSLPDGTRVFPAHGAGSACGKNLSTAHQSTIGEQRRTNYALAPMSEDEFVATVTEGQSVAPLYFLFAADSNRRQRELLDDRGETPVLDLDEVLRLQADGAAIIDGRGSDAFALGHFHGSINVGLDGRFAEYAGDVLRPDQSVVLVTDPGRENEARIRLARIGFDHVAGALTDIDAVLTAHPDLADRAPRLTASELQAARDSEPSLQVVDVRNPNECVDGIVDGSVNLPLPNLLDRVGELDPSRPTVVYCAGGYRSATAASLLRSLGFATVADIDGGYAATCQDPTPTPILTR